MIGHGKQYQKEERKNAQEANVKHMKEKLPGRKVQREEESAVRNTGSVKNAIQTREKVRRRQERRVCWGLEGKDGT